MHVVYNKLLLRKHSGTHRWSPLGATDQSWHRGRWCLSCLQVVKVGKDTCHFQSKWQTLSIQKLKYPTYKSLRYKRMQPEIILSHVAILYLSQNEIKCFPLFSRTSLVAPVVKNLPERQETGVWFLGREDPLEKEMAILLLAWRILWTEELGRLQPMGSQESDTT